MAALAPALLAHAPAGALAPVLGRRLALDRPCSGLSVGSRWPRWRVSEAVCKPSSVAATRVATDGHPSPAAGCPTAHAADPRAGQRTSPPAVARRVAPSYLALHRVELAAFHSGRSRHRHCGAGPRLAADGCCPLPCAAVLGLSSRRRLPDGRATIQPPR